MSNTLWPEKIPHELTLKWKAIGRRRSRRRRLRIMMLALCNFLSPVTSSLFGPDIYLSTLFSAAFNLCFSLNERDQVSHP
jgi:hypothetical protein